jgi:FKBP-type peptidyl-prolyl cis-trans isomerase
MVALGVSVVTPNTLSMRRPIALLAIFTAAVLAACDHSVVAPITIANTTFASSLGINLASYTATSDGLYYRDIAVGGGTVADTGMKLSVRYTGYLKNGVSFDSNTTATSALQFTLGHGEVIKGWDLGVKGMRVGGRRSLLIPPSLGYGQNGQGTVPGNAVMVFTVNLISTP